MQLGSLLLSSHVMPEVRTLDRAQLRLWQTKHPHTKGAAPATGLVHKTAAGRRAAVARQALVARKTVVVAQLLPRFYVLL